MAGYGNRPSRGSGGSAVTEAQPAQASQSALTGQKARWAARAEMLRKAAEKNDAAAQGAYRASRPTDDPAFWTQPGRSGARSRANAAGMRGYELQKKAENQRARAAQLERMARTNAGDAARKRERLNTAWSAVLAKKGVTKGSTVYSATFGREGVVQRVNAKSITVRFPSGYTERLAPSDIYPRGGT